MIWDVVDWSLLLGALIGAGIAMILAAIIGWVRRKLDPNNLYE